MIAILLIFLFFLYSGQYVQANDSDSDADLAQELSNSIADLITIPIQMNYDRGIGQKNFTFVYRQISFCPIKP